MKGRQPLLYDDARYDLDVLTREAIRHHDAAAAWSERQYAFEKCERHRGLAQIARNLRAAAGLP